MARLRESLSAQPRADTEIVDVRFEATDRKEAELLTNVVLEQFIAYVGEASDATEDALYRQLVEQYKSLEAEILGRETVVAELSKSLGTELPQELISSKRVRLDALQASLSELQQSIAILEWTIAQSNTDDVNGVGETDNLGMALADSAGSQPPLS